MAGLRSTSSFAPAHLAPSQRHTQVIHIARRKRTRARPVAYVDEIVQFRSSYQSAHAASGDGQRLPTDALLRRLVEPQQLDDLVSKHPAIVSQPLGTWLEFLAAYGVSHAAVRKLVLQCPELFIKTNIYAAG